jgi:acetyl-CoA acetyltransferase
VFGPVWAPLVRDRSPLISGLGLTAMTREEPTSARALAVGACRLALQDAALGTADIDGLMVAHSPIASCEEVGISFQRVLGLRDLRVVQDVHAEGSSVAQLLQNAALYIGAGLARHVLCVFADASVRATGGSGASFALEVPYGGVPGWEGAHGLFTAVAAYALEARRHMALYGTTEAHLGAVAASARRWSAGNPLAIARRPLTADEYLSSPWVAEPFRKLDCAYPVNGGAAVIVSSGEAAAAVSAPVVELVGCGQAHGGGFRQRRPEPDRVTGAGVAARRALRDAGLELDDIDVCEVYDCFTFATIALLEDIGFCARGDGGPFVADGNIDPGGSIPTNTGGGQLAGYYLQGMTPVTEAIIQLRRDGGDRQVVDANVALVCTHGGIFDHHAALVLQRGEASGV